MNNLIQKNLLAARRAFRTRRSMNGTADKPRLSVNISHRHVTAQLVDDDSGKTLAYVTTVGSKQTGNLSAKAVWVGEQIAAKAQKAKVKQVIFDRGAKQYHGRVKALADAARQAGLEI